MAENVPTSPALNDQARAELPPRSGAGVEKQTEVDIRTVDQEERWTIIGEHNDSVLADLAAEHWPDELPDDEGVDLGQEPPWYPDQPWPGYSWNHARYELTAFGELASLWDGMKRAQELGDKVHAAELLEEEEDDNDG